MELDHHLAKSAADCMLMNIGCQDQLSNTDVFMKTPPVQEVDHSFPIGHGIAA